MTQYHEIRANVSCNDRGELIVEKRGFLLPDSVSTVGWAVSVYEGHATSPHVGDAWFRVDHFRYWQSGPGGIAGGKQFSYVLKAQAYYANQSDRETPDTYKRALQASLVILIPPA